MNKSCPICGNPKKFSVEYPTRTSIWSKTCGNTTCLTELRKQTNLAKYGHISNLHSKTDNGLTILENSIRSKYGVSNISQIDSVKEKKQKTCLSNFGVKWPMQSAEVMEKSISTVIEKYGVDNVSKHKEVVDKIKNTQFERYGSYYVQTDECKELIKKMCQEKYNVDNYFSSNEFREKLENRCMELFGVTNPFFSSKVQAEIAKKNGNSISKEESKWLDSLGILNEHRQYSIVGASGKKYNVDGFDPYTNTVYEYNGSFWHGNPDYYDKDVTHPIISGVTHGDLYEKTLIRQNDITDAGYNLVAKWSVVKNVKR